MPYKDKDKQRAAARESMRRRRQGITASAARLDVNPEDVNPLDLMLPPPVFTVTPEGTKRKVPINYGQADCACMCCAINRRKPRPHIVNHGAYRPARELSKGEINRMSLPGDVDYEGLAKA